MHISLADIVATNKTIYYVGIWNVCAYTYIDTNYTVGISYDRNLYLIYKFFRYMSY